MVRFREGTPDTMIARLCDAISGFDKEWVGKCRPASEKQIRKLQNIVGKYHFKLPDAYLYYLRAMGKDDVFLLGNENGRETGIDVILEELEDTSAKYLERGFLIFSWHWADAHFFLRLSGQEPQVVDDIFSGSDGRYVAGSFEKYLFQQAFIKYKETFAYHTHDSRSVCDRERDEYCRTCCICGKTVKERMEYVQRLVRSYGLEGAWFGDQINYFWCNEKYTLEINVQDGFWIEFSHNDAALQKKVELMVLTLEKNQRWLYQLIASQEKEKG